MFGQDYGQSGAVCMGLDSHSPEWIIGHACFMNCCVYMDVALGAVMMTTVGTTGTKLPPEVKKDFEALRKQVDLVHAYWTMIKDLFGRSEEQLQLLNEAAGSFFFFVQRSFLDSMILGLSRLTDDPGSGDRENLVLQRLATAIGAAGNRDAVRRLRVPMKRIRVAVADLREYRDTVVAHSDRKTAWGECAPTEIQTKSVEDALAAIRDFMNEIDAEFHDVTRMYDLITMEGGAPAIVTWLEDAQAFRQSKYKKEYQQEMIERLKRQASEEPL